MASADIRFTLSGGEAAGGLMRFEPEGMLQGSVQVVPQEDIRCNAVRIRLQWHTEGRGTRDEGIAAEIPMAPQGTLQARVPLSQQFNIILPKAPWSYAGHYINIVWELKVTIDIPMASDLNATQAFILAPGRDLR
jgi:hypothetical protein